MIDKDDPASIWWGDTEALTEAIKALSLDINKNQKGDMNMTSEVKVTIEHEDGHKQELNGDTIICFTVSKAGEFLDGKAQIIDAQAAFIVRAIPACPCIKYPPPARFPPYYCGCCCPYGFSVLPKFRNIVAHDGTTKELTGDTVICFTVSKAAESAHLE